MFDTNINPVVKFPTWDIVEESNTTNQFIGYEFMQKLNEKIYVKIECQNKHIYWESGIKTICFSFCNEVGFSIIEIEYPYCEDNYYKGVNELLEWAKTLEKVFSDFRWGSEVEWET